MEFGLSLEDKNFGNRIKFQTQKLCNLDLAVADKYCGTRIVYRKQKGWRYKICFSNRDIEKLDLSVKDSEIVDQTDILFLCQ